MRRKLAAGNWKMNGVKASLGEIGALIAAHPAPKSEVLICPPATLIAQAVEIAAGRIAIGGQDCHMLLSGPHTGDISAAMLKDAGASYVILGHSERREEHSETDATVRDKAAAAHSQRLVSVICVGESAEAHQLGQSVSVVRRQLAHSVPDGATAANTVLAYEPIWAIGSGHTPTAAEIAEVHGTMRQELVSRFGVEGEGMRLLYGGSVKPGNAAGIFAIPDVDGALVGGASLTAKDFGAILSALDAA